MAVTYIGNITYDGENGGTTGELDTTGADFLVAAVAHTSGTPNVTDSKNAGNWTALTEYGTANPRVNLYYRVPTTVGTGHTFTVSGSGNYPGMVVFALGGIHQTAPYDDKINGFDLSGYNPYSVGSVTPTTAGSIIVVGGAFSGSRTGAVSTFTQTVNKAASNGYACMLAYKDYATTDAFNPSATAIPDEAPLGALSDAVFYYAAAGAPAFVPRIIMIA